jgi:hypothetical protein
VGTTPAFSAAFVKRKGFKTLITDGPWVKMEQTLKEGRSIHVSFLVPDELVNCH